MGRPWVSAVLRAGLAVAGLGDGCGHRCRTLSEVRLLYLPRPMKPGEGGCLVIVSPLDRANFFFFFK